MAIEAFEGGTMITGEHIGLYRLLVQKQALALEIKGIKVVRHSVYAQVKRERGWRGSRENVLAQLTEYIKTVYGETQ